MFKVVCQKCRKTFVFACPPASVKDACLPHAYLCTHLIAAKVAPWCFIEHNMSLVAPVGISHSCQADLRWQKEEEVSSSSSSRSCVAGLDLPPPLKKQAAESCFNSIFINWTGRAHIENVPQKFGLFQRWRSSSFHFRCTLFPRSVWVSFNDTVCS